MIQIIFRYSSSRNSAPGILNCNLTSFKEGDTCCIMRVPLSIMTTKANWLAFRPVKIASDHPSRITVLFRVISTEFTLSYLTYHVSKHTSIQSHASPMDHFSTIHNPVYPPIKVPVLGSRIKRYTYDHQGFYGYPERAGFALSLLRIRTIPEGKTSEDVASFLQAWLFFFGGVVRRVLSILLGRTT